MSDFKLLWALIFITGLGSAIAITGQHFEIRDLRARVQTLEAK